MKREPVPSDNLRSVGFDASTSTLEIEFQNGAIYQYFVVPSEMYHALLAAPSIGSFFVGQIRNRFPSRQVG